MHVQLNSSKDVFRWSLHQNGQFSVQTMYKALINNGNMEANRVLWDLKLPLKIKIFMLYLKKGVILTKDNLARRNWNGNKNCCFCSNNETIQHLFFACHFARFLWRPFHIAFDLDPPKSINDMFGNWLIGLGTKLKGQMMVGTAAL